jgi:serine/threonine protein kinase
MRQEVFAEGDLRQLAFELMRAVSYLHTSGLHILNLHPTNIYITEQVTSTQGQLKLGHFGEAWLCGIQNLNREQRYVAPEEYIGEVASLCKVDTWTIGCILMECASLSPIKYTKEDLHYINQILNSNKKAKSVDNDFYRFITGENIKSVLSQETLDFILKCVELDCSNRLDAISLIDHPIFKSHPILPPVDDYIITLKEMYYWWRKFKGLNSVAELENEFIEMGLIDYLPPILSIPCIIRPHSARDIKAGIFLHTRISLSLKDLRSALEQDIRDLPLDDSSSGNLTLTHSESLLGRLATIFKSKSSKSMKSEPSGLKYTPKYESTTVKSSYIKYKRIKRLLNKYPTRTSKLVEACRDEIPSILRPDVWKVLLGINKHAGQLYSFNKFNTLGSTTIRQVAVDIPRCHQYHPFLSSSMGRNMLESLLKLWLQNNPQITYLQGLDSLCAVFIALYEEDEITAYSCFDRVMGKYLVPVCKDDKSVSYMLFTFKSLLGYLDPQLCYKLHSLSINPEMYATAWFLTLFARNCYTDVFPINKVYMIWDTVFLESSAYVLFIGVAILRQFRKEIMEEKDEGKLMSLLINVSGSVDLESVLKDSYDLYTRTPSSITLIRTEPWGTNWWEAPLPENIAHRILAPFIELHEAISTSLDALIVDIRPTPEFKQSSLPNAINMPIKSQDTNDVLPKVRLADKQLEGLRNYGKGKIIVLFGDKSQAAYSVTYI